MSAYDRAGGSAIGQGPQGRDGDPGPQGVPGPAGFQKLASTVIGQYKAAAIDASGGVKLWTGGPIAGVMTEAATIGQTKTLQTTGPLTGVSLGAGVACAVGVKADGTLCRVTDASCVSGLHFAGRCDAQGRIVLGYERPTQFNPVDFGATGDNVTDDLPAFEAMFRALGAGGACFIPTPSVKYYLSGPLRPDRPVNVRGSGKESCILRFGPGAGFEMRRASQTLALDANKSTISDLFIECAKETYAEWAPNTDYAVGAKVRCKLGALDSFNAPYQEDLGLHMVCTQGGTSGATQPEWNDVPDGVTVDGGCRWESKAHSGVVVSTGSVTLARLTIYNVTDDGIFAYGTLPTTNADGLYIEHCIIISGDGNGIHVKGSDGNACAGVKNTVQGFHRGAMILDRGFLSNSWAYNDGADCRRSYAGIGNASASVWIGNYSEAAAPPKIKRPHSWLGGSDSAQTFAPETDCMRMRGGAYVGAMSVESVDGSIIINTGIDEANGLGSFQRSTDFAAQRTVWIDPDADNPGGIFRTQWRNSFDVALEVLGEKSLLGPGRHRYPRGVYVGSDISATSRRSTFVTSLAAPPTISPDTSGDCGRYLWRKGDVVHNCNAGSSGVTPGWIAARDGGWGAGRSHTGRVWVANAATWFLGEGIEPSTPNGKVYQLTAFEKLVDAVWVPDTGRVLTELSDTEPTWPTSVGQTVKETVTVSGVQHRITWTCYGDVGMTWAVLPAPNTEVTT